MVVVGGGPAGLMAARKAAESNIDVLLLEKRDRFGLKACGEAVSASTLADAGVRPSTRFISNDINGTFVYAPDRTKRVRIEGQGYILKKEIFLQGLASLATKAGAEIWIDSKVLDVRKGTEGHEVVLKKRGKTFSIKAKAVIGCDGVGSIVAKKFFKRGNYATIPCVQYKMVDCEFEDLHMIEIYLGSRVAPQGYAWIFPKSEETANVGVGIGVRHAPVKTYLSRFVSDHPRLRNVRIAETQSGPVPIGGQIEKIADEAVMLCGDAAGQVMPLSGSGIHSSIVAGKVAGEVVGEVLSGRGTDFQEYPRRYAHWSKRIGNSLKALRLIERLTDQELNWLAEILTGKDIVDLTGGLNIKRIGMKLLKHPRFALTLGRRLLGD